MGSRIACIQVPLFPLAARLRSEPELHQEPLAIVDGNGNAQRIIAANRRARQAGIQPRLTLAQARALLPELVLRRQDKECERAAQAALLDVAETFSPRIEDGTEGLAFLDADGLERHYPGTSPEVALGRDLTLAAEKQAGLPAWVGIAASKLAARLAAGRPFSPTVIPAGAEAELLAPLSLHRITSEARILKDLDRWGVRTLGELAALPKSEVVSRLGAIGDELHSMACGEDPKPLVPRQPPAAFREGMELEWPLVNLEPFVFIARAALERLTERLLSQGLGCVRLELSLDLEPDGHHQRSIALPAPTRDVKTLLTLIRLDLERHPPGAPVAAFSLTVHPDQPRAGQMSLFGPREVSPDKLATALARLFAILGEDRVGSPRTVDGHLPERFKLASYTPPSGPRELRAVRPGRGLLAARVFRPSLPLEVLTAAGSPEPATAALRFCTAPPEFVKTLPSEEKRPQIEGRCQVVSGPWNLQAEWWTPAPAEREYWDVELPAGAVYRIFRERGTGDWYADGIYD